MVDLLNITPSAIQDETEHTAAVGNVENTNGFHTNEDAEIVNEMTDNVTLSEDDSPPKRIQLQTPVFLKPAPKSTWKPIATENQKRATQLGIESIFPNICFYFLRDDCVEGDQCYDSHEMPSNDDVGQKLAECGSANAAKLFRIIIARIPKLVHQYFHTFVNFLADHQLKDDLNDTITICERQSDEKIRTKFFQQLVQAFIRSGETYSTTMVWIYWNLEKANDDVILDTLLRINLVEGTSVSEFLSPFRSLNECRYHFNEHIVKRLLFLCVQSENALPKDSLEEFARLIFEILKNNFHVQKKLDKDIYDRYMKLYGRIRKQRLNLV